nr:pimeloyl-ACP methyl ester esterase BioH [Bowmanella dokdonensis]
MLLHGWGLNSAVWHELADGLKDRYRVSLLDLPGFGLNRDILPEQYDLPSLTRLVAGQIERPTLILGWSLGGLIAQQLALSYPQMVRGLVCVTSSPRFVAAQDWPGIKPEVLRAFASQLHSDIAKTIERFLAIQALGSARAKADILALRGLISQRPLPASRALAEGLNILELTDLRQQIRHIACPTLRIYGGKDSLVPAAALEQIEALQPASSSMLFPSASHAPFISHSGEFVIALGEALAKMEKGSQTP